MQDVMQALYLTRNARGLPASARRYTYFLYKIYCISMKKGMIYGNMHKFRPSFFMLLKMFFSTLETFFTSPFISHMVKYNHERDFPFRH